MEFSPVANGPLRFHAVVVAIRLTDKSQNMVFGHSITMYIVHTFYAFFENACTCFSFPEGLICYKLIILAT